MKKLVSTLISSLFVALPASADYLLTIDQMDGTQSTQCIKSYSFSTVTDTSTTQDAVLYDVYSDQETLTNKVFMDKPVYRKVIKFPRSVGDKTISHDIPDYDDLWVNHFSSVQDNGTIEATSYYAGNTRDNFIRVRPGTMTYYGRTDVWTTVTAVLEYTKLNDDVVIIENPTKTYLNYIPSDTGHPVVMDINGISIKFSKDYAYDNISGTCLAK